MRFFSRVKSVFGGGVEQKASLTEIDYSEIVGSAPTASGVSVNSTIALHVPAVLQAVRLISETGGFLPCKLYRDKNDDKEVAKDHPAYKLVHDRANEWTSAPQLRVDLFLDAFQHGAGFAEVVRYGDGRPFELHRLKPGSVQRRFEDNGEPFYIVQRERGRQQRLSFRDVLYFPAFGGFSPVMCCREAVGISMKLERYTAQLFASGARPSGIIWNDKPQGGESGAKTVSNILKSWREWQQSANGDPLILDSGWKYDQPAMSSTDAQFIENRHEQVNELARVLGVPPHLLFQLDRATWSNAEQMGATFLQLCLRPWLDRFQDAYTTVLLTEDEQSDHYFEFVTADLERADAAGRAEIYSKLIAARVYTPNEIRARENMPPLPGGDELINPYVTTTTTGPASIPARKPA